MQRGVLEPGRHPLLFCSSTSVLSKLVRRLKSAIGLSDSLTPREKGFGWYTNEKALEETRLLYCLGQLKPAQDNTTWAGKDILDHMNNMSDIMLLNFCYDTTVV